MDDGVNYTVIAITGKTVSYQTSLCKLATGKEYNLLGLLDCCAARRNTGYIVCNAPRDKE